ncbi:MAG: POTRA domain-containing protein, partial [Thermodesulfovibrionales bacterium]
MLLVCLCVLLPLVTSGANSWADEVIIESVEVRGLSSMPKEQFLELLGLHAGQSLDADLVRVGIKRAFLTMKFNDIVISTKDEAPSQVIVDVDEKYVISDIGVEGNRLLRKSEVRKNFRIREKQYLYPQELTDAVEALRKSLVDKGFPAIRIDGSIRYQERKRRAKITLVVREGEPLFIRKIVLKG